MNICAVAYTSRLVAGIDLDKLESVVADAVTFNKLAGVTGLLVYDARRIVQYIEGPEDGVRMAYARIRTSASHANIVELNRGVLRSRVFPAWSLGAASIPTRSLERLLTARWTGFCMSEPDFGGMPTGLDQLSAMGTVFIAPPPGANELWH